MEWWNNGVSNTPLFHYSKFSLSGKMKEYKSELIRNIVLMGHSGAGKTTLGEAMLFNAKATSRLGKIGDGTSILDYTQDEIERGSSISLGIAWLEWQDKLINLIDTPGYYDFWGDVLSGARAADTGIILINASTGIQPGTIKAKTLANKLKLPIIIFVNQFTTKKLAPEENIDLDKLLKNIKEVFGKSVTPLTILQNGNLLNVQDSEISLSDTPYKAEMLENIAETDDSLTEKYLNEEKFTPEDISNGLSSGLKNRKIIPLFTGDAYNNVGVAELLNGLTYTVSPLEREEASSKSVPTCFVFKTIVDPHFGDMKCIRVFSGTIKPGTALFNSTKKTEEKINQIYVLKGKEREETSLGLVPGMIGVFVKLKNTQTGDTLTEKKNPVVLPTIEFPEHQEKIAIVPKTKKDEEKVSTGLSRLRDEDPSFDFFNDVETKQTIISGLGEVHLNVILTRLKQKFNVEVNTEKPRIHYRETITKMVEQQGKYKRQTGGHGQYGDCWIKFEPLETGKDFEFVNAITQGRIPARFIPSVEKGLREALSKGVLAGFPAIDFRATLYDGSFHEVDSSDIAFKIAAGMAFREGFPSAGPTLLEPILSVGIVVPSEYLGDVMGELSARRGRIEQTERLDSETSDNYQKIHATVPEVELYGFSTTLRSLSQGTGYFSQKFSHYERVPQELQQRIIAQNKTVDSK